MDDSLYWLVIIGGSTVYGREGGREGLEGEREACESGMGWERKSKS